MCRAVRPVPQTLIPWYGTYNQMAALELGHAGIGKSSVAVRGKSRGKEKMCIVVEDADLPKRCIGTCEVGTQGYSGLLWGYLRLALTVVSRRIVFFSILIVMVFCLLYTSPSPRDRG